MFIFGCLEHEVRHAPARGFLLDSWQVAGIAAKAKSGHYPIDSRLQAVFQAGILQSFREESAFTLDTFSTAHGIYKVCFDCVSGEP